MDKKDVETPARAVADHAFVHTGFRSTKLGQVFEVMLEGPAKKRGQLMGRNDGNKIVVFSDNVAQPGELVNVRINEVTPNTLIGELA